MCYWYNHRIATLRDTVYLDGGHLSWVRGMADGTILAPQDDGNPLGLIYTFNFSTPFNASTNVSTLLGNTISKAPDGGAANNFGPNYIDGALLYNDDEFFLYGGLLRRTSRFDPPAADSVLGYEASQYGTDTGSFRRGFINNELPGGMTRYVAYGGAANAPSENKAWYFGGYRSESWGPLYEYTGNSSWDASNISDTLITLDMGDQQREVWTNDTLPQGTPSRASPSVVWIPVGPQGILVVLGGVSYPGYGVGTGLGQSLNEAQSKQDSPGFMQNIDIYDIADDRWYRQPTIASPPQLAMGCAVVATAQDYSSFNIYYYGGYDGLDDTSDFNDDVWILSLPSFMWMKVSSGTSGHARAGHQCVMPYPDQMITIGGRVSNKGQGLSCVDGTGRLLDVYNLTSGNWMESYDPESWNEYGVPEMIHVMIGGDYSGGATLTTPTPSGWATPELASVFATPYPTTKLATYYPYSSVGPGNGTRGEYQADRGGTPSWLAPVLGVVLGLVFVTAVVVAVLLYRRRKLLKKSTPSEQSTDENGNRIMSWMQAQQSDKAPTVTTEDTRMQYDDMESRGITPVRSPRQPEMRMVEPSEMLGTPVAELPGDLSSPAELPVAGTQRSNTGSIKYAHLGSNLHTPRSVSTPTNQPYFGSNVSHDHGPSIDSSSGPVAPYERPDSPSLGADTRVDAIASALPNTTTATTSNTDKNTTSSSRNAVVSGISGISNRDVAHLRQLSDATVSSATGSSNGTGTAPDTPPLQRQQVPFSSPSPPLPTSPPSVGRVDDEHHEAVDYLGIHAGQSGPSMGSPLRRSVFREHADDLGEKHQG
ncbi:hypothetical protein AAE478_001575 [Parahypoxylon ruwenzoriense]